MPKFTMKAITEEDKKKSDFVPLEENMYNVQVTEAEWEVVKKKEWRGAGFVELDEEEDRLVVTFKVLDNVEGTPIKTLEGKELTEPTMKMFIVEKDLGWDKKNKCPKDGRALVCALKGLPAEAELEFDEKTFIGEKVRCFIEVYPKKDGSFGNKLTKFRPIK